MLTRRAAIQAGGLAAAIAAPGLAAAQTAAATDTPGPATRLVFEALVDIAASEDLGPAPLGTRRIVPILGGSFAGPRLRGRVRPGGADRQLVRSDGVRQLHALYELETDDGAVITVSNRVLVDEPAGGPRYAFSHVELAAPDGPHGWLNRRLFVGTLASLRPSRQGVRVRVFELA